MANELAVGAQGPMELAVAEPSVVLEQARRAAAALQQVISKKKKPVILNGEQYLEFEDWQTLGQFYGYSVATREAVPCEIEGVKGAKAKADLINLKTGEVAGSAEAYCLRDEPNWRAKPWFQLASMAQTRAGAKALRNRMGWVPVLAGYRPTPAEEMEGIALPAASIQDAFPVAAEPPEPGAPVNGHPACFTPSRVEEKKKKNGSPFWVVYDGKESYAEFDKQGAAIAQRAMQEGKLFKIAYETSPFGNTVKYRRLEEADYVNPADMVEGPP